MKLVVVSHGGQGGQWVLGTHGCPNCQNPKRFAAWAKRKYGAQARVEPKQPGKVWGRYGYDTVPGHPDARQP